MTETVNVENAAEMAHCALFNFDNLARMNPALKGHPMFIIARGQLVDALQQLGRDPADE